LKAASEMSDWAQGQSRYHQKWYWNEEVWKRVIEKRLKYKAWCHAKDTTVEEDTSTE